MKRISQLDGVRGIAILLVLVWHYFPCQVIAQVASAPKGKLAAIARLFSLSWSGVDLFFVLSGFLIAGILLDHRNTSNYFRVFYTRRVCRIFPLYFILLALFVWLSATRLGSAPQYQWLFRKPLPIWSYATFTQNIFMGRRGGFGAEWLGVTWSLAVEEQFYLFVPLVIYLLPRRLLFYLLVCAVLAAPVLRCLSGDFNNFVNTPWRADSLLSGASLAVLVRWKPFIDGLRDHRLAMRALFGILMAGAAVMTVHPKEFGEFDHFWLAGLYTVFIAIAFAGTEQAMTKVLRFPVLVWLGQLSYGIYMFHQAISGLLHGWLGHGEPQLTSARDIEITLLSLALTLILAAISYYFFEKPILHFGRQFQYLPKLSEDAAARTVQSPL